MTKKNDVKDLEGAEIVMLPIKAIRPNEFNCNVMKDTEYKAMKNDMKLMANPEGMATVMVRELDKPEGKIKYEIIDGEHRWRAAGELNWKKIKTLMFTKDKITQNQALILNFKINMQRGTHDPYKEARFFDYLVQDQKLTQNAVAKLVNVNRSTVNKRISILKIEPEVIKSVPHGTDTPVSVLEVIAQAPTTDGQKDIIRNYHEYNWSVHSLERDVKQQKHDFEKLQKFIAERDKSAKFPNCPKCGKLAEGKDHPWWADFGKKLYYCEDEEHHWDPKTGEISQPDMRDSGSKITEDTTKGMIRCFRSPYKKQEVIAAARKALKKIVNAHIDQCTMLEMHLEGDRWGDNYFHFKTYYGVNLSITSDQGRLSITSTEKPYKDGENKSKVDVSSPEVTKKQGTKKAEDLFDKLMHGLLSFGNKSKKKKSRGGSV